MITAVDTNVLIDVFGNDQNFAEKSAVALEQGIQRGRIVACEVVWAETCAMFPNVKEFVRVMYTLGLEFSAMEESCAQCAGDAWRRYRKNGGKRTRMMADFMIGAHALKQCDRLLTRDRGFYRNYFPKLKIIDSSTQ